MSYYFILYRRSHINENFEFSCPVSNFLCFIFVDDMVVYQGKH